MKRTSLKRGRPLRANPEKVREFMRRSQGRGFRERESTSKDVVAEAYGRSHGRCVVCGSRKRLQPHHILPVNRWPGLLQEPMNVMALCAGCHDSHERWFRRVLWGELPDCVFRLAQLVGRDAVLYLERYYPRES